LTGPSATKGAFLAGVRRSDIIHFAGHSTSGDGLGAAQLLLAPDSQANDSGVLDTLELDGGDFSRVRVVVLAGCRTGSGAASPLEGAMSLARPFLAAGVPSVIASLWDVDDAASRRFFLAFHRGLLDAQDPALALHRTQRAFLHDADPALAHPATWGAFVHLGGLDPRALPGPSAIVAVRQPS
jgi:CHAT domain-containing protein